MKDEVTKKHTPGGHTETCGEHFDQIPLLYVQLEDTPLEITEIPRKKPRGCQEEDHLGEMLKINHLPNFQMRKKKDSFKSATRRTWDLGPVG